MTRSIAFVCGLWLLVSVAVADSPLPRDGLSPAEAVKRMQVPPGFRVTVFAAEPELVQPGAFCIDERGRVWVAENINYTNRGKNLDAPRSRISVYEDADGDGRFDAKKVVVESIFFPCGRRSAAGCPTAGLRSSRGSRGR